MGTQPPPPKGHSPQFSAHICCSQMAGWIKMPLGTKVGVGPGHIVLHGDTALPPQEKGHSPIPQFSAHVYCGETVAISATAEHLYTVLGGAKRSSNEFSSTLWSRHWTLRTTFCQEQEPSLERVASATWVLLSETVFRLNFMISLTQTHSTRAQQ